MQKNKIIILTTEPFPEGGAAANRILCIAKALLHVGFIPSVYCLRPADRNTKHINSTSGVYQNVIYKYFVNSTLWPNNKQKKMYVTLKSFLCSLFSVFSDSKNINCVFSTKDSVLYNISYYLLCKIFNIKYLIMLDEFPYSVRRGYSKFKLLDELRNSIAYRFCDKLVVMTTILEEYYRNYVSKDTQIFVLPMTVDFSRFDPDRIKNIELPNDYIAYCGVEAEIDGVDILINVFSRIYRNFPKYKLLIIGDNNSDYFRLLKEQVKKLNIVDKIIFTGRISRDEVPTYLINAKVLLLPRKNIINGIGGFPTKLGEYLATGKPVIISELGEIPKYLKDGEDAIFVAPGDEYNLEKKLTRVLENYSNYLTIGNNGRKKAKKYFDYMAQIELLEEIINGK